MHYVNSEFEKFLEFVAYESLYLFKFKKMEKPNLNLKFPKIVKESLGDILSECFISETTLAV